MASWYIACVAWRFKRFVNHFNQFEAPCGFRVRYYDFPAFSARANCLKTGRLCRLPVTRINRPKHPVHRVIFRQQNSSICQCCVVFLFGIFKRKMRNYTETIICCSSKGRKFVISVVPRLSQYIQSQIKVSV